MKKLSVAKMVCRCTQTTDGGWAWVITFASFMVNVLVDGVCCTFGVIFPTLLNYFGETKAKTQLLNSILVGVLFTFGPVSSVLVVKYGCRRIAGTGTVIASLGLFLSSFSSNLDIMIVFYSIVGGIGFGMMYLPAIVIICSHFETRKALATGIVVCGTGVGVFVFAPLSEFLLDTYSWRGTMWIIAALNLHGVVFAATYTTPEKESHRNVPQITRSQTLYQHGNDTSSESKERYQRLCLQFRSMFDFSLLKSPTMLMYGASCFLIMLGFFVPNNFLPAWANDVKLSSKDGSLVISLMGVSTTISRGVIGYIADKSWVNRLIMYQILMLIGGVSTCCVPFCTTFLTLSIYAVLFGSVSGTFACLRSLMMLELLPECGPQSSFGLVSLSMGLAVFIGPPISGALSDFSGTYHTAFYFGGSTLVLGSLISLPLRPLSEWERSNSRANTVDVDQKEQNANIPSTEMSSIYTISDIDQCQKDVIQW